MKIRMFEVANDYDMVCEWALGHRNFCESVEEGQLFMVPKELLPPNGVVIYRVDPEGPEDIGALWLYLALGVSVCFAEYAITKPGLRLSTAKLAMLEALQYFKFFAKNQGYHLMIAHTVEGCARYLEHAGWYRGGTELIAMSTTTSHLHLASQREELQC